MRCVAVNCWFPQLSLQRDVTTGMGEHDYAYNAPCWSHACASGRRRLCGGTRRALLGSQLSFRAGRAAGRWHDSCMGCACFWGPRADPVNSTKHNCPQCTASSSSATRTRENGGNQGRNMSPNKTKQKKRNAVDASAGTEGHVREVVRGAKVGGIVSSEL